MSLIRKLTKHWVDHVEPFSNLGPPVSFGSHRVNVSRDRAMRITTVWNCIKIRAETIGMLPVGVVEKQGSRRIEKESPTWLERPNPETTTFDLMEMTSASIDADGNSYWYLEKDNLGRLREVWVLPPSQVQPFRDPPKTKGDAPGPKRFKVGNEEFDTDRILQIPGFKLPGRLRGMSPIEQHSHALGLAAAAEEYGESFFANGATMQVVLSHPGDPGEDGARRMRDSFARDHQGIRNAHKPGILFGGTTIEQLTIPNDQAQFLETRKYQREEICGVFRVPPHKVQILDRATFSNIEHQAIEWVQDGLMPGASRIERSVAHAGLLDDPADRLKINFNALLRGDTLARFAAYAIGRQWGWLSVDDILEFEDRNPLPDGQGAVYLEPLNMRDSGASDDIGLPDKVEAAGALVRAGYDPTAALVAVNLDPIRHLGLLPATVQNPEN